MTRMPRITLAAIALLVAGRAGAYADDTCQLVQVANLPMGMASVGVPTVPVSIGDHTVTMLVDTGGNMSSMLNEQTAMMLGLVPQHYNRINSQLFIGTPDRFVIAHNVRIGNIKIDPMEFPIMSANRTASDVDGTLSPDLLRRYDVDLDFANGKFALYLPDHCPGRFSHWTDGEYARVEFTVDTIGRITFPVMLDGKEFRALLITPYARSNVALEEVESRFDIDTNSPNLKRLPGGNARNHYFTYPFRSLTFQGITINNPDIGLVSHEKEPVTFDQRSLILGMDIVRLFHLYIAYREHVIYVTPASAH